MFFNVLLIGICQKRDNTSNLIFRFNGQFGMAHIDDAIAANAITIL